MDLTHHFLIAMPSMADTNFAKSLTYICEHNEQGALGVVVNRPIDMTLKTLLEQIDIPLRDESRSRLPVYFGGPVQVDRGFVLHRPPGDWESTLSIAGLTRALAADHSSEGIRVNAVGPGPIFTPFHERRIAAAGETVEQYNAQAARGTMLKRPGRAEEVAAAILFLASDDASYVTGALLFVDGGMTAL